MTPVNSLLEQLHDIEGLDPVSLWPFAIGWWIVIGAGIAVFTAAVWLLARRIAFRRSWKYDTMQKLAAMENSLMHSSVTPETVREAAVLFSEYLRRIALRKFSRSACAGLVGEEWLQWLSRNDAKHFDWETKGRALVVAPYSPACRDLSAEQMKELIQAAKEWVC